MVKTLPPSAGGGARFLIGELRFHTPHGQKKKKKTPKQKHYCNKFDKDLKKKVAHIKKKIFKGCG